MNDHYHCKVILNTFVKYHLRNHALLSPFTRVDDFQNRDANTGVPAYVKKEIEMTSIDLMPGSNLILLYSFS